MKGKIIKGISGFYYVHTAESGIYECRAKGIFRNRKIKPLVGDNVEIEILHEADKEGNIIAIESRKNELIRPSVSNINQALLIFSVTNPAPNYNLLDRFLVMMRYQSVPVILCFCLFVCLSVSVSVSVCVFSNRNMFDKRSCINQRKNLR